MGGIHMPRPDACRRKWSEMPVGNDEEHDEDDYDDAWADTPAANTDQEKAAAVPMAVDQQPQQQDSLPKQTYVPPEVRVEQQLIWDKAKSGGRSQADKAADGKQQSPVRTTGALCTDQVRAELNSKPEKKSC